MKHLKIYTYNPEQDAKPEKTITMPLSTLHVSMGLIPKDIKTILKREGIDLGKCSEFKKEKNLRGTLIEIQNRTEKVVISLE